MKAKEIFLFLLGLLLGISLFLLSRCSDKNISKGIIQSKPVLVEVIETNTIEEILRDTIIYREKERIFRDTIHTPEKIEILEILRTTDDTTLAIIAKRYYNKNVYVDTIYFDKSGYVIIKDTLQKNGILHRTSEYEIIGQKNEKNRGIYVGGFGEVNPNINLGAKISFVDKSNKWIFGYGYNITNRSHNMFIQRRILSF